jgi:hypothetical protein
VRAGTVDRARVAFGSIALFQVAAVCDGWRKGGGPLCPVTVGHDLIALKEHSCGPFDLVPGTELWILVGFAYLALCCEFNGCMNLLLDPGGMIKSILKSILDAQDSKNRFDYDEGSSYVDVRVFLLGKSKRLETE